MPSLPLTTYKDLIDHLTDWCGANPGAEIQRDARRSILSGLQELMTGHRWSYYYQRGRIATAEPYETGTVAYDHTGGESERMVTLTDGTWPSWAAFGSLVIDNVTYDVATRVSDTVITLTSTSNPGEDVAAGEDYTLYRDTYPLPNDLISVGQMVLATHQVLLHYEHPGAWLERQRIYRGVSEPRTYTVTGSPDHLSNMALRFYPAPDQVYQADYIYQRQPRLLRTDDYSTGTVTTTSGSASVTGSGTSWAARHVGTVFRVSRTRDKPTGRAGANPAAFERVVTAVNSATSITLDSTADESLGAAGYILSDPVDIEPGAMMTALLRAVEHQMAHARRMRDRQMSESAYTRALVLAREADSRNFTDERMGQGRWYRERLADMPLGADD